MTFDIFSDFKNIFEYIYILTNDNIIFE